MTGTAFQAVLIRNKQIIVFIFIGPGRAESGAGHILAIPADLLVNNL